MGILQQPSRTSADIDRKITFPLRSSSVAKAIKFIGIAVLLLSSSSFWLLAFRFVSLPFLISSWVLFVKAGGKDLRLSLATWAVWLDSRAPGADQEPMAGILLYTAAPDSEGTLGGLVSLGEPKSLGRHLDQALEGMKHDAVIDGATAKNGASSAT